MPTFILLATPICDVWDEEFEVLLAETGDREEAADPDEHRFHVPPRHHWSAIRKHATQIGWHLNNAFAAVEDANLRLHGVFGDVDFANQERFPDARLERLLAHFEKHRLRNSDVPPDMLGDTYMYLIEQFAEGAVKKGGEFYTPRQVVKLIVDAEIRIIGRKAVREHLVMGGGAAPAGVPGFVRRWRARRDSNS